MILGIDPGTSQSAYVLFEQTRQKITSMGILSNEEFYKQIKACIGMYNFPACIEDVSCYGMPVGREVFEMVRFSGRLQQLFIDSGVKYQFITRRDIKLYFCNSMKAKDGNIRQALIDRFGSPGPKKNHGVLYGVKADMWSALALAVYGSVSSWETKKEVT